MTSPKADLDNLLARIKMSIISLDDLLIAEELVAEELNADEEQAEIERIMDDIASEPEEAHDHSPHKYAVDRALRAKILSETEGIPIGLAIAKLMEAEDA